LAPQNVRKYTFYVYDETSNMNNVKEAREIPHF